MEAHIVMARKGQDFTAEDATFVDSVIECLSPRPTMRRFIARWRDEETGQWQSIAILAYTYSEAQETIADLVGHTAIQVTLP